MNMASTQEKKKNKVKISYVRKVMPNKASKINGIFNSKIKQEI